MRDLSNINIAVIGLGYVGLPLAVAFGAKYPTEGIENNPKRFQELLQKIDKTRQIENIDFDKAPYLSFKEALIPKEGLQVFIVTVPTLIDSFQKPDLGLLIQACREIGQVLKKNDVVIFESTVYPGCTEDDCVPILEQYSGLKFNTDFFCGYSPERINPGDKKNTLTRILKITSGSTPEIAEFVNQLYASIIEAGTYLAPSIKVAEAAKLIENCQRDVNISFVNELALIFDRMNIDTKAVLEAAGTKWNFLKFQPGLVGGHCIGVDPYYMLHKSEQLGYYPALIGSGRRINDNMGIFVANKVVKLMIGKGINVSQAKALILGITFKENCPDIRNTKVIDIYQELLDFGIQTEVYDPWADAEEVDHEYGISLSKKLIGPYDLIIHAVNHKEFETIDLKVICKSNFVLYDVKSTLDVSIVDARL
jgi:UDP-N-acetyl-D-galactosamine dehydrogenase